MKGTRTHKPTLGEKTRDIISGLFSKSHDPQETPAPRGDDPR